MTADYRPLPAIVTIDDAIAARSFHSAPAVSRRGDAAARSREARIRLSGELRIGGQEHFYLETQCAIAWLDETGRQ